MAKEAVEVVKEFIEKKLKNEKGKWEIGCKNNYRQWESIYDDFISGRKFSKEEPKALKLIKEKATFERNQITIILTDEEMREVKEFLGK